MAGTSQRLEAAGSRDLARARAFAEELGVPRAHGSYEDLVADPGVDIVYVATPHSEHLAGAMLALRAGKPVLVEKSFALDAAQARAIIEEAGARGLFCMEAMWTRFLPHQVELRQRVADGMLGEIVAGAAAFGQRNEFDAASRFYSPYLGGGALLDRGVYTLSWLCDLLGRPGSVTARAQLAGTGVDGHVSALLEYPARDASAVAQASVYAALPNTAWLAGSRGYVEVPSFWEPAPLHFTFSDGRTETWEWPTLRGAGYEFELAAAARSVSDGETTNPVMPPEQTLAIMELMDAIRSQVGITWPPA
jgi:predicted dehydrogenase